MAVMLAMLCAAMLGAAGAIAEKTVTMTFAGDVTLGCTESTRGEETSFDAFAAREGYDYFFDEVRTLFSQDDVTVVNLEGVLSASDEDENMDKNYRFRGDPEYAKILTSGSVEMVNLANNHTYDYGERGYADTQAALDAQGVAHFGGRAWAMVENDGVKIAFFGLSYQEMRAADRAWAAQEIARIKAEEGVNAVVLTFHAGREYSKNRNEKQQDYARYAVDAGADLVIMHHPHVVQGMSVLSERTVLYSLGNFCFGGNKRVRALETLIAQVKMTFDDDGAYLGQQVTLYAANVSGDPAKNDYQPRLVTGDAAKKVMSLLRKDTRFTLEALDKERGAIIQPFLPAQ